jgi:hypothetical protein
LGPGAAPAQRVRAGGSRGHVLGSLPRARRTIAVAAGSIGTLVFGVWLAISLDAYQVWDGWVIAAIVLWAIAFETGRRSGEVVAGDVPSAEARSRALVLHGVSSLAILLLLIDMIWKPGA